ncbi:MAG TPA: signal peptidase I [Polyangia bacterium]
MTTPATTTVPTAQPRRPLVALFAGLLLPGLGQVYNGEPARGAALLFSVAMLLPSAAWLALHGPRSLLSFVIVLGVVASLAIYVYSIKAAYRTAARLRDGFVPGPWNRGTVYFVLFVFGHLFVLSPLASYAKGHLIESFKVPSASMLPTIMPGDRFFADKRVGHPGGVKLRRGAIAVFLYPNDRTTLFVKRIVGLPGDRVDIDGVVVKVNGVDIRHEELHDLGDPTLNRLLDDHQAFRELAEQGSYTVLWRKDGKREQLSTVVPNGQVFVLGDNRDSSHDSRHFGVLPLADVSAVARQVWFSADSPGGIRLRRTGRLLD